MKVKCVSTCQLNREKVFKQGIEYEITTDMYEKNKNFFEAVKEEKTRNDRTK